MVKIAKHENYSERNGRQKPTRYECENHHLKQRAKECYTVQCTNRSSQVDPTMHPRKSAKHNNGAHDQWYNGGQTDGHLAKEGVVLVAEKYILDVNTCLYT